MSTRDKRRHPPRLSRVTNAFVVDAIVMILCFYKQDQTAAQINKKKLICIFYFLSVSSLLNSLNVKNTLSLSLSLYTFNPPYFHSCPQTYDPESH